MLISKSFQELQRAFKELSKSFQELSKSFQRAFKELSQSFQRAFKGFQELQRAFKSFQRAFQIFICFIDFQRFINTCVLKKVFFKEILRFCLQYLLPTSPLPSIQWL
jgi:hypothetical protein